MKSASLLKLLSIILGVLLIISVLNIDITDMNQTNNVTSSLDREPFTLAATYSPGDYPSGLNLSDGDILDASSGGVYNITGNFTIVAGVTVTIAEGSKLVVYADNIIIDGTLNGNSAGYAGGLGTRADGNPGNCIPSSGGGEGGDNGWVRYGMPNQYVAGGGGGGGSYGSNGEDGSKSSTYLMFGSAGGLEFGLEGFESLIPNATDISMGAGGGGGGAQASEYYEVDYNVGYGGDGGGGVYLEATDTVLINGILTCNGGSGHVGTVGYDDASGSGGGGGGAGGGILLLGEHVSVIGTLTTTGGSGGSGGVGNDGPNGYDGGDGSGGRIKIAYRTSLNTTGSTISEGSGGLLYTYQLDLIKPTFTPTGPTNNTIHQSGIHVVVNISDSRGLQSVSYNWDDDVNTTVTLSNSSYELSTPIPVSDGEHVLEVFAQDNPGNWNCERYTYIADDTSPSITFPEDITYSEGSIGHRISWTLTDENPLTYTIMRDNETLESDIWTSGMEVNITVDGLSPGVHVYTLIAIDEVNNQITDTVVVTVEQVSSTTTTTPENTTTPTSPLLDAETLTLMLASGIGGAVVVIIIVFIMSRKRGG